jgi:DNA-binding protein H-NS
MSEYVRIQAQIEKLKDQAEKLKKKELSQVIANIKKAISAYGLTAEDLGLVTSKAKSIRRPGRPAKLNRPDLAAQSSPKRGRGRPSSTTNAAKSDRRSVVAPKFRDSTTGATWTGRGKQPKWLAQALSSGRKIEEFKI